jgi:predicted RNase H-like nuclease
MSTTTPSYVGVDWDAGSWLAVAYDTDGNFTTSAASEIGAIWDRYGKSATRIVIDVPIGLCDALGSDNPTGERDAKGELVRPCDRLARSVLKAPRSSSVFNAPARGAVEAAIGGATYQDVNQKNKSLTGKGLTQQSASLAKGIHAVDKLLKEKDTQGRLVEGHPEICFQAFADEQLRHSKKTAPGVDERLTALESTDEYQEGDWRTITQKFRDDDYVAGLDDVLDATVLAVTACATEGKDLQTLPPSPGKDSEGRPMQMVYRRSEPFEATME